jgi:NitT/TauT family transport system permease protein
MTRRGPLHFVLRLIFLAALVGLWQLIVVELEVPAFLVPPPSQVARALYAGFASKIYLDNLYVTVIETLAGFALGCALAFLLGSAIALSRTVEYYLHPLIVMVQSLPKVALVPLMVVWFGLDLTPKVVTAALVSFFPLMVNLITGLRSADEDRVNLMRALSASRWQIFRMLQLPNALPYMFAGLESAMSLSLIGIITAELYSSAKGLGMQMQSLAFNMDVAGEFSILFILAILGLILNGFIRVVRRRVLFWDPSRDGGTSASKGDVP